LYIRLTLVLEPRSDCAESEVAEMTARRSAAAGGTNDLIVTFAVE
jgi:hypothetical protein